MAAKTAQAQTQPPLTDVLEHERINLLRTFVGDMSHDLMTPITIMRTNLYLLNKAYAEQQHDKHSERVQVLSGQLARMEKMIKDMLLMVRLDGAMDDEFTWAWRDLNALITCVADDQRAAAARCEQHLLLEFETDGIIPGYIDEDKLMRAVTNLIDNAIRYTPRGGRIIVRTGIRDRNAFIEVEDNGIGIAPDDLPRIFERFYRVEKHRSDSGGAGLGLPITLRIIEEHGGRIEVHSIVGQGSLFRILLPHNVEAMPEGEDRLHQLVG